MEITGDLIKMMKCCLRVKSPEADEEVRDLIAAAVMDMETHGITVLPDPLTKQAIKFYCKAHYGYEEKSERFLKFYEDLRDSMSLNSKYKEGQENG